MYLNKRLKRSYIFGYIMVAFGLMIPVLLSYKQGPAIAIFLFILVLADLAGLIVSHVYYPKDDKIFFWVAAPSIGLFDVLTIVGLIMEAVMTSNGLSNKYAWINIVLSILASICLTVFFLLDLRKKDRKKKGLEI